MPSPAGDNVSVQMRDFKGLTVAATAFATFADGDTIGAVRTAIRAWLNLLNNVTGTKIVKARYELEITPTGAAAARTVGQDGVNAEVGLLLTFPKADNAEPWSFWIPGAQPSVLSGGAPNVNEGGTIDLLADEMENVDGATPIPGTTGGFWISSGGSTLQPVAAATFPSTHSRRRNGKKLPGA